MPIFLENTRVSEDKIDKSEFILSYHVLPF